MSVVEVFETVKNSVLSFSTNQIAAASSVKGDSINFMDPFFLAAIFFAFFNPIAWNLGGRIEYHTHLLTKICGGRKYLACYIFSVYIFGIGIIRDVM